MATFIELGPQGALDHDSPATDPRDGLLVKESAGDVVHKLAVASGGDVWPKLTRDWNDAEVYVNPGAVRCVYPE